MASGGALMERETLSSVASKISEAEHSALARLATDAHELRDRLLRIVGALAMAKGALGDAYDRAEKTEDAASARVTADACRAFAERLHSL